jgi:hypothetical protein
LRVYAVTIRVGNRTVITFKGENKMGRPLKKRFFGDKKYGTGLLGLVGGEGIASVIVTNTATNSGYSTSTIVTWSASTTTQIAGGVAATGTATVLFTGNTGRIQSLNITNSGTGFISTSGITITFTPSSAGTAASFAATLTSGRRNAITFNSYITTGSSAVTNGDIIKQTGSRTYLVQNSQGRGDVRLVATATSSLTKGQMNITATDYFNAVYLVSKLSSRKATVVRYQTGTNGTYLVATGPAKWSLTTSTGTTLLIPSTI